MIIPENTGYICKNPNAVKKIFLLVAFILLNTNIVFAQSEYWRILTTTRPLTSINFLTPAKAWIFGGDIGYRTTDGGVTWSQPIELSTPVGGISVYDFSPKLLFFIDSLRGWACQFSNSLLKTVDGGNTWATVSTNIASKTLQTVFFINNQTGWAGGWDGSAGNKGVILKTTNGGISWIVTSHPFNNEIASIWMINESYGFCNTSWSDSIAITDDGGNSWMKKKIGNGQGSCYVVFKDSLTGWMLGYGGPQYISRTIDGGQNWSYNLFTAGDPTNFYFLDNYTGWIINSYGSILKSTNGGINWITLRGYQGGSTAHTLLDIYFKNFNTGWISAYDGSVLRSTDGGLNWSNIFGQPLGPVASLDFSDMNTGWIITKYLVVNEDASIVWKTTNRGYNWLDIVSYVGVTLNSLDFIDNQTGYLCGNSGVIYKTTNSGNNWVSISYGNNNYESVFFTDANTGYLCGTSGAIVKTTNGGANWLFQISNTTKNLNDICFADLQNGYIASDSGFVLKTTNSGQNWSLIYPLNNKDYRAIYFINPNTGFAVGDSRTSGPFPVYNRVIVKTTNAGLNWTNPLNETAAGERTFSDILFMNDQTGWVASNNGITGYIRKTTNGGVNWIQTYAPIVASSDQYKRLNCIKSLGEDFTWAGGENGTILSTSSPIGIQTISTIIPMNFYLHQNYPNPFNPQTKIKFDVPASVKGQMSNVKLVVYDLLGREVAILVNEELKPGTYETDWDASNYSSGVYFYRIISDDYIETKKMVLMK